MRSLSGAARCAQEVKPYILEAGSVEHKSLFRHGAEREWPSAERERELTEPTARRTTMYESSTWLKQTT